MWSKCSTLFRVVKHCLSAALLHCNWSESVTKHLWRTLECRALCSSPTAEPRVWCRLSSGVQAIHPLRAHTIYANSGYEFNDIPLASNVICVGLSSIYHWFHCTIRTESLRSVRSILAPNAHRLWAYHSNDVLNTMCCSLEHTVLCCGLSSVPVLLDTEYSVDRTPTLIVVSLSLSLFYHSVYGIACEKLGLLCCALRSGIKNSILCDQSVHKVFDIAIEKSCCAGISARIVRNYRSVCVDNWRQVLRIDFKKLICFDV